MKALHFQSGTAIIKPVCFDLALTLDCGQAFRWERLSGGKWHGTAFGRSVTISELDNAVLFEGTTKDEFNNIWSKYFDLDRNYGPILEQLSQDELLCQAIKYAKGGIRILRQEPWEAICSFIISQCNNIPRIKKIIKTFCEIFGENIGEGNYSFPSLERVSSLSEKDLDPISAGYRARYIVETAKRLSSGFDIPSLYTLPIDKARKLIMTLPGVGLKVADCSLLYGFGRMDAFPIDTWMKRVISLYPNGLPDCMKGFDGIAQQYLFHWIRNNTDKKINLNA